MDLTKPVRYAQSPRDRLDWFVFEFSQTYCVDSQVADSACSATAFMTGVKGNFRTIGVPGNVMSRDCMATNDLENQLASSVKWAQQAGKRTGVVSTMRVTHATPAGAYANVAHRDWECDGDVAKDPLADPECRTKSLDIARQLIERDTGRNLNVSGATCSRPPSPAIPTARLRPRLSTRTCASVRPRRLLRAVSIYAFFSPPNRSTIFIPSAGSDRC